ncbi:hypothetical protein [Streptomyces sp. NPDC023588]|uniref:hypothetical protein n=1 Tax=Streptomyces sp. NPDC023588 TaxID=3154907 RepID=UPI0033D85D8C
MAANNDSSSEGERASWARRHSWRNWNTVERVLAALAALIAVITGVVVAAKFFTKETPMEKEQALVQTLRPGQAFTRATQIMKESPHYSRNLPSGNTLYQYDREWERIQLLVNPSSGEVLSVGIYADNLEFQPKIKSAVGEVTLNRDPLFEFGNPTFAFGSCGAHTSSYYEAHPNMAGAGGGGSAALGVTDSKRGSVEIMQGVCGVLWPGRELECIPNSFEAANSGPVRQIECLSSPQVVDLRKKVKVTSVILSRESQLTADMFNNPYEVARGNQ